MKRIKAHELPSELTQEVIDILASMANEVPVSLEWKECASVLNDEQKKIIYARRSEKKKELLKNNKTTPNEIAENKRRINFSTFDGSPKGNMWNEAISPYPEEYKILNEFILTTNNIHQFMGLSRSNLMTENMFYDKIMTFVKQQDLDYLLVDGDSSILGMHVLSNLEFEGKLFTSQLQYLVWEKSGFFAFDNLAEQVLNIKDAHSLIKLSKEIPFFSNGKKSWSFYKKTLIRQSYLQRFEQDALFRKNLIETTGKYILFSCKNQNSRHQAQEDNLIGELLTFVRISKTGQ